MGKFYLENKHKWFLHLAKKDHARRLGEDGTLIGATEIADELRFYLHDGDGPVPKHISISEHGDELLLVSGANGAIGFLDAASTNATREFLAANPHFFGRVPAVVIGREEWSDAYLIRLGMK